MGGAWIALRRLVNPETIRIAAESILQDQINGRASIGSAELSWSGGIRFRNVQIFGDQLVAHLKEPNSRRADSARATSSLNLTHEHTAPSARELPIIEIPEIQLDQSFWSLVFRRIDVRSVTSVQPTVRLSFDLSDGKPTIAKLFKARLNGMPQGPLPPIELRDARLIFFRRGPDGSESSSEEIQLTLRGRASGTDPALYDVVWQNTRDEGGYLQLDVRSGLARNVRGGLPSISVETLLDAFSGSVSESAGQLRDFKPSGWVVATDFDFLGSATDTASFIELSLTGGAIAIPISENEKTVSSDDRYLHFHGIHGQARFTQDGATAELSAIFRGAECRISASATAPNLPPIFPSSQDFASLTSAALRDRFGLHVTADITGLRVPRTDADAPDSERRFVQCFTEVEDFYRHYDPRGTVDAHLEIEKPPGMQDPAIIKLLRVTALNGSASFFQHPYLCTGLTGVVEYGVGGIAIRDLCGKHEDATVCVNGSLERPSACAPAKIDVTATDLAIDDNLYAAVGPKYDGIRDQFSPHGKLDARIHLERNECVEGETRAAFRSAVEIDFKDIEARYDRLPLSVDAIQGNVKVGGDRFSISKLSGHASGGTISVKGGGRIRSKGESELTLDLTGRDLRVDEGLISALPKDCARQVAQLHPSGRFDFHAESATDAATKALKHHTIIQLNDVALQDVRYPLSLSNVRGEIDVKPDELVIRGVTGRHENATVSVGGTIGTAEIPRINLAIEARDLLIDDSVRSAVSPRIREILTDWRVDTPIDANLFVRNDESDPKGVVVHGDARLDGDIIRPAHLAEPFRDVHATVEFDGVGTRAEHIEAKYAGVPITASFDVSRDDDAERGTICVSVKDLPLDAHTRDLLPARLQGTWDSIKPAGKANLNIETLRYVRPNSHGPSIDPSSPGVGAETWEVSGRLELRDASFSELARMSKVNGVISAEGFLQDRAGGTSLNGMMNLAHAEFYDRLVEDFSGNWAFARTKGGSGHFVLDRFTAAMYGGELAGKTDVRFDVDRANYDLSATLNKVSAGPLINAGRVAHSPADTPVEVRGQTSASLYLSGIAGAPDTRRGGGRVEIQDGYICKLPLLLALFNVVNMAIPSDDTIDQAESDFFIMGKTLTIRSLFLQGGGATFEGSGTISIPDEAVDLSLVNARSQKGFRVPLISNLIQGASRELMEINVTGPLSHPVARARPLPNLSDEMHRIFQARRARPIAPSSN